MLNNADDMTSSASSGWASFGADVQFEATCNQISGPEPAFIVVLGNGLACVVVIMRHRRKNQLGN